MEPHRTPEPSVSELWSLVQCQQAEIVELKQKRQRRFRITVPGRVPVLLALGLLASAIGLGPTIVGAAPRVIYWTLEGNAGTNPSTNYVGTSDANGLSIRTNGTQAIDIDASQTATFAKTIHGDITGNAAGFTGNLGGDVTGGQLGTVVGKLQGTPIGPTAPTQGQVLKFDGSSWAPGADSTGMTSVATGSGLTGDGTSGSPIGVDYSAVQRHFARTYVVSTVSELNNALSSAQGACSLIHLEPGTYDLGTSSIHLNTCETLEGSGENTTKVTANGTHPPIYIDQDFVTVRDLTVQHIPTVGFGNYSTAIWDDLSDAAGPDTVELDRVAMIARGAFSNVGLDTTSSVTLRDVTATVTGGNGGNDAIYIPGATRPIVSIWNSVLNITGAAAYNDIVNGAYPGNAHCISDVDGKYNPVSC